MSNGSTIRTMQDDLDEAINKSNNTKTEELKSKQNPVKPIAENHSSDVQSVNPRKQKETVLRKSDSVKEAPVIVDTSVVENDNNKLNNSQDDQLTRLIKKANSERDKDVEDKDQEVVEKASVASHQDERTEDKKNMLLREVIDDQNNKEADVGENSIDDLKNLIGRISKPSTALKNNSATDNLESKKISEKGSYDISEKSKFVATPDVKNIKNVQDDKKFDYSNKEKIVGKDTEPAFNKKGQEDSLEKDMIDKKNKQSINENKEVHKEFLWSDLAKKINGKKNENKIDNTKKETGVKNKKNDEINSLKSGVLNVKNDRRETKENKSSKEQSLGAYNENYISPNERLIHGKQEFYSSVSKSIKHKSDNDDIESLKESERIKNEQNNIITKDEEYKKLKRGIIQKYHIKLSTLPWKKIILLGTSFVILVGISVYLLFSKKQEPPVVEPPMIITGFEIEKFAGLEEVIREKKSFVGLYNPNNDDEIKFNNNVKAIKFRIVDSENNNLLTLEDALAVILKKDKSVFSNGFFEATTGKYNIFIFETEKGAIRYGLAIETNEGGSMNDIMKRWEANNTNNKKMISVFKNLFIDDASGDYSHRAFTSIDLNGVEINYAHLEDKDTALNYFIHNNILVITTSIDNNSTMIDLVTGS